MLHINIAFSHVYVHQYEDLFIEGSPLMVRINVEFDTRDKS